jgi:HK97 family phage major capsid protein
MPKIHEAREKRAAAADAMRAMLAAAESGGRDLTPEEQAKFDQLKITIEEAEAAEDRAAFAADLDKRSATRPTAKLGREVRAFDGHTSELRADFDGEVWRDREGRHVPVLAKRHRLADLAPTDTAALDLGVGGYLRALALGPQNELERRVLGQGTIGAGGALVPAPLAAQLIDRLRARSVAMEAGAQTVPMTAQTLAIARQVNDPAAAWRNENAAIAESDPSFDRVSFTARSLAVRFNVSRELLEDGQNTAEASATILAGAMAVALDAAVLVGSGTAPTPQGIRGTSGLQSVSMGTNGAALTGWAPVLDLVRDLEAANAGLVSAMIAAPRTARSINGLVDSTGQPLQPPPRLAGIPLLVSTGLPITETQGTATNASTVLAGDFAQVMIGLRTALQVSVLDQRYAELGQVGMIAWLRADVQVARPAAIGRIVGIIP